MNLSEKELLLLEAYRAASPTEKQRVESILNVHEQVELEELEKMEWSEISTGSILMKLFGMDKEEVRMLSRSLNSRKCESIRQELVNGSEASKQKVKEILGF